MKLNAQQTVAFFDVAHAWASSTLDTRERTADLLKYVEGLMTQAHNEGIQAANDALPSPILRMHRANDIAAETLADLESKVAAHERRRQEKAAAPPAVERRKGRIHQPFKAAPRSEDMRQVASVMNPQHQELIG